MKALITGVLGQDGSYLAEYLMQKGCQVIGLDLNKENTNVRGIVYQSGSLADDDFISAMLLKYAPDQVYNLASISQIPLCSEKPEEAIRINITAVIKILEIIRHKLKHCRFLQASSSEMYGYSGAIPFNEKSIIEPASLYGMTKAAAYQAVRIYRRDYNLFAANAIFFNHTSPRHAPKFVISKMIRGAIAVKLGNEQKLALGNLEISKDWGFAGDYVKAMAAILEHDRPDDFVVGSGKAVSLKTILDYILNKLGLSYNKAIMIDQALFRPNEPKKIYSDPSKIMKLLGWKAEKSIEEVLDMMIAAEMEKQGG